VRPEPRARHLDARAREAIEAILTTRPDLVLLDVQMPELTGFDVVRTVGPERMPPVIFATVYDRYALRAFEVAAIDYLLKPFEDTRFHQALDRARELIRLRTADELRTRLVHLLAPSPPATPRSGCAAAPCSRSAAAGSPSYTPGCGSADPGSRSPAINGAQNTCLRLLDDRIPSCSRYFATVRRAMSMPVFLSSSTIF
jgi:CheY-like chemotaxis protein